LKRLIILDRGEALHTFFLNDQKESKTSCSLSFERPKEIVYCFLGKKQGKPYLTFFLNDEKESKQSMSRALHFVQYRLRRGKRIADTALSANH